MKKYLILIVKLIVFAILFGLIAGVLSAVLLLTDIISLDEVTLTASMLTELVMLLSTLLAAWVIIRFWDKLPFVKDMGLSLKGRGKDVLCGLGVAAVIYAVGFGLSLLFGWVSVKEVNFDVNGLLARFLLMLLVAMFEESMTRGFVLGHMLNVGMNKYLALVLSATIFASLHLGNPGITVFAFVNLILAGVLLGSAYIYTRNLWFAISLHLFWNWIQGPVLGYQVSGGAEANTLLTLTLSDNTLMTGGDFGFEGSLPCTILMLVAIGCIIYQFEKSRNNEKAVDFIG